ncbi:MAG: class I SAM-dependent methyltransferase [Candidatus Peregrinibacteria bacterium]|nr:class I SAM-dependent methyltransferase [Candidatus Peregrinibacteria bacterium]
MKTLLIGSGINQVKSVREICTAIDISQEYLDAAKKFKPKNIYLKADVQNMPFEDNLFDKVIFTHVLEHVDNPEKAISEIRRVLKAGGKLFLEVPTREMEEFLSKNNSVFKKYIFTGYHKTHYDKGLLKNQLSGFSRVSIKSVKGQYVVFWYLWGKFLKFFNLERQFYIEECGQIHSKKYDWTARQFSRFLFILNIILSPILFRNIDCEYHVIATK